VLQEYILDGEQIRSLDDFYDEFARKVTGQIRAGRNLDALDDILRGGFGPPLEGFVLRWADAEVSKKHLSHSETVKELTLRLERCHPTNRDRVRGQLADARNGVGPTVFDWIVETIRNHGPGGEEAEDNVHLILE
jgi:RNAse (barnase) inhibitor barstar